MFTIIAIINSANGANIINKGEQMSKENKTTIALRVSTSLRERLEQEAKENYRNLSQQTEMVLMAGIAALGLDEAEKKAA